ncbi:hypothetical protein BG004_006163 [Podila humilis]|nr:hypothetical protein BG004_006163 [Podila humilis]
MSLRLSALHPVVRHTGVMNPRAFFSSSSFLHSRAKPTLTTIKPKKTTPNPSTVSPSAPSPASSSAKSSARTHPSNNNINTRQSTDSTPLHNNPNLAKHSQRAHRSHQQEHLYQSPFPSHNHQWRRGAFLKAFAAGSITIAGVLGIYSALSDAPQFHGDLSVLRSSLTNPSTASPTSALSNAPSAAPKFAKSSLFEKRLQMLSEEEVEARLAQNQHSFKVQQSPSEKQRSKDERSLILGYSINQIASNNPIEDDLSRHVVRAKDGSLEKVFFGVFDGHGGWCCSQKVAQELAPSVASELEKVNNPRDVMAVMEAIENGFLKLDDRIVNETVKQVLAFPSRPLACSSLLPAISGSCALMAYVNVKDKDLYVACTGDSRAVLGVQEKTAKGDGHVWKAVPLSFDQTGRNRWEVKRLQEEHPGEENTVVMRGRVLGGLEPTRAFGDSRYKWTKDIQEQVFQLFPSYRQPHRNYHTPPYVTAKPVVKHHKIGPEDRFLVMATDGLWDKLTSEEVIQLVGDLLDGKTGKEQTILDREQIKLAKQKLRDIKAAITGNKTDHQVEEEELTPADLAPKGPASQIRMFTFKDMGNASTHLVRNALGGGDDDRLAATLSIPAPMSRVYRDDITVTVIFFGEQDAKLPLSTTCSNQVFIRATRVLPKQSAAYTTTTLRSETSRPARSTLTTPNTPPSPATKNIQGNFKVQTYISKLDDPCTNLAFEEWLFRNSSPETYILFLYRNSKSVIIGRNQNPWKECNLKQLDKDGVPFVRRKSGGGTVYHDIGNTNYSIMMPRAVFDRRTNVELICRALHELDIPALVNERHDIVLDGKKISPNSHLFCHVRCLTIFKFV